MTQGNLKYTGKNINKHLIAKKNQDKEMLNDYLSSM